MESSRRSPRSYGEAFVVDAYYMGWIVYPVNAVRASHSAVDLRTCTDATNLDSKSIEVLVRGLMRIFVLKRFGASMNICDITRSREL